MDSAHLVITGGEPLLWQNQIIEFIVYLHKLYNYKVIVEVETNATIKPDKDFDKFISYYNCSPKISNSNIDKIKRYKEDVLRWFVDNNKSIFKFVINDEADIQEILTDYIPVFGIRKNKVWLMPVSVNKEQLENKQKWLAERCIEEGFNYSNRLHIQIWNKTVGV